MSYNTIIEQGSFIAPATIVNKVIPCRIDPDWIEVWNYTQFGTSTQYAGVKYYWQKGMAQGTALAEYHAAATSVTNSYLMTSGGIFVLDTSSQIPGPKTAITTGTSNAAAPVVTTSNTTNVFAGSGTTVGTIVRFMNSGSTDALPANLCGFDYEVGALSSGASFTMRWSAATAFAAGTLGHYTIVPFDPIFYPRARYILNIQGSATTGTTNTVRVTTSVSHGYTVGQKIRLNVPAVFGTIELDGVLGTVTAVVSNGVFDLDVVSNASITAFAFPAAALSPFVFAQAVPVGENTAAALAAGVNVLGDAEENQAAINIVLGTGMGATTILGPAGSAAADVLYWRAGRSFSNN